MTDTSNYGITVGVGTTSGSTARTNLGSLYNVSVPKIVQSEVESTNHGTGNVKTFIPGGLYEVGEFKLGIAYDSTDISASLVNWCKSGTNLFWFITFPSTKTWDFKGFIKEFSPSDFDATSPAVLMADVTIRSTGSLTLG